MSTDSKLFFLFLPDNLDVLVLLGAAVGGGDTRCGGVQCAL